MVRWRGTYLNLVVGFLFALVVVVVSLLFSSSIDKISLRDF